MPDCVKGVYTLYVVPCRFQPRILSSALVQAIPLLPLTYPQPRPPGARRRSSHASEVGRNLREPNFRRLALMRGPRLLTPESQWEVQPRRDARDEHGTEGRGLLSPLPPLMDWLGAEGGFLLCVFCLSQKTRMV